MIRSGWLLGLVFPAVLSSSAAVALGVDGRFGAALAVGERYAAAERNPIYFVAPLSVECWVRIGSTNPDRSKSAPTIFLANEPRHSVTHWQLYAQKDTGALAVSMPGWDVPELVSKRYIVDSKWHHVGFIFDGDSLRLFADGTQVASAKVKKVKPYPDTGPLTMGHFPGVETNRDLLLDEVRLSRVARPLDRVSDAPFTPDPDTIGLWHFDAADAAQPDVYPDVSLTRNPARLLPVEKTAPADGGFDGTLGAKTRWSDMDYGPLFSSTLKIPAQPANVTHKAVSVRLDDSHAIAFDTELLRVSAAWTGDFLKIAPFREGLGGPPDAAGNIHFSTPPVPGWSDTDGFADTRPDHLGPLPRERARFTGLYPHGRDVVLSYRVYGTDVLELNGAETITPQPQRPADPPQQTLEVNGETITTRPPIPVVNPPARSFFTRTIELAPHDRALSVLVCDEPDAQATKLGVAEKGEGAQLHGKTGMLCAAIVGHFQGLEWRLAEGKKLALRFPPAAQRQLVKLVVFRREPEQPLALARFAPPVDLTALTQGGPARYPEPVVTKGTLGTGDGPYVVDTLTPPADNPWKSFLRFGGLDFFSNGDAAVCSVSGDVWVVSGIDDKLESLKWRRFATGLFQPLGLKIVDDKVYVLGRDQITRLHDLNADGEADFYENFNNDAKVTPNGHAYVTCLETDPQGNFYYLKCSDNTEHGGTVLRVSRDGQKLDVFATGVRNPNGMGVSPTGVVTEADNQGEWVPASRLDVVYQGEFLGFQPMSKQKPPPADPGKPLCWMPQNVDNSSGGQTWVAGGKWGPFDGAMLHTSYGAAALLLVLQEKVDGHDQGGVVRFPLNFDSGIMRARFRPADGQLYLCGLRGWQTSGVKDATLQRVRYTGKPVYLPSQLSAGKNGILLGFTCALDKEIAADPDSYSLLRWNYKWSAEYGSRQWSVADPKKQGYDTLKVKSAELLKDGKTVRLTVEDMRPAMQMQIGYDLESADGTQVRGEIYNTVHVLRNEQ